MITGFLVFSRLNLADRTGLEPATSAVTGRHSNQLNYRSVLPCGAAKIENIFSNANLFYIFFLFLLFPVQPDHKTCYRKASRYKAAHKRKYLTR
jgi:hypothetical protein